MTVNLDRFAQGLPDPQDVAAVEECQGCGRAIYPGEDVYVVDGYILHAAWECLVDHLGLQVMTVEEALEVGSCRP